MADYVKNYDPKNEHCWIAEVDGENAGSVFVVKKTEEIAKLRMLLVEPWARGLGIGKRLVGGMFALCASVWVPQNNAVDQ